METVRVAEQRFPLTKARIGRARGWLAIVGSTVEIDHPLMKAPLRFPVSDVAAVLGPDRIDENPPSDLFRRDVRVLPFAAAPTKPIGLVLVLRNPVMTPPFKYGTERAMPYTARERKRGLPVDVLALQVDDPARAVEGLRMAGATVAMALSKVLLEVIGTPAPGVEMEQRAAEVEATERWQRRRLLAVGLLAGVANAARVLFAVDAPGSTLARVVASAVGCAIVIALPARWLARRRPPGAAKDLIRLSRVVGGLSLCVVLGLILFRQLDQLVGASYVLAVGLLAGGLAGLIAAATFWIAPPPTRPVDRPRAPSSELGGALSAALVLVAAAGVVAACLAEPGVQADLDQARAALLSADDLGPEWFGGRVVQVDRGPNLDEHLCGGEPSRLPAFTAGVHRAVGRPLELDGLTGADLGLGVMVAPDEAAAEAELALVDAPAYVPCSKARAEATAEGVLARSTPSAAPTSFARRVTPGGLPFAVHEVVVPRETSLGGTGFVVVTYARAQVGRAVLRVSVALPFRPMTDGDLEVLLRAALDQAWAAGF